MRSTGGVRTPTWAPIEGTALRDLGAGAARAAAIERVGLPPCRQTSRSGSALGVTSVSRGGRPAGRGDGGLVVQRGAVVETAIVGMEIAVGVLGTPGEALPAVEIVPKGGTYDYAARYTAGATEYFAPARLGDDAAAACRDAAMAALEGLGLRDVTRVDMIVDRDDVPLGARGERLTRHDGDQPVTDGRQRRRDGLGPAV